MDGGTDHCEGRKINNQPGEMEELSSDVPVPVETAKIVLSAQRAIASAVLP